MDIWEPIKHDVCRPRFKAIEGSYFVRVLAFDDGKVTFVQVKHGIIRGRHTMSHKKFIERFDLVYRNNVIQFKQSA